MTIAIYPTRLAPVDHATYVRRRLAVALVLIALIVVGWVSVSALLAHTVLADRGGVPASTPAIRSDTTGADASSAHVNSAAGAVASGTYLVRSGDTLWSIAQRLHGRRSVADYVDRLVAANHGTTVQIGQLLTLP